MEDVVSIKSAEFLPDDFKHCATVAMTRHQCKTRRDGLAILHLTLTASVCGSLFEDEAREDNMVKISEIIVPSPPPLTTVVTGRELGRPQRTPQTIPLCTQHLNMV